MKQTYIEWEKQKELFKEYKKTKDASICNQIIKNYNNLVYKIAKKYSRAGIDIEDLVQEGYLGLLDALERFDLEKGYVFSTFSIPFIKGKMKRYIAENRYALSIPEYKVYMIDKINKLKKEKGIEGVELTDEEIMDELGITEEQYENSLLNYSQISIDAKFSENDEDESYEFDIPSTANTEEEAINNIYNDDLDKILLETLKPKEYNVIINFYGLFGNAKLTQKEIAEKMGTTRQNVSLIKKSAIQKLKNALSENY